MKYREPPLLEAVEGRRLKLGDEHPHTLESWKNLIELYETSDKPEKAEEWRGKAGQSLGVWKEKGLIRLGGPALCGVWPKVGLYGTIGRS